MSDLAGHNGDEHAGCGQEKLKRGADACLHELRGQAPLKGLQTAEYSDRMADYPNFTVSILHCRFTHVASAPSNAPQSAAICTADWRQGSGAEVPCLSPGGGQCRPLRVGALH